MLKLVQCSRLAKKKASSRGTLTISLNYYMTVLFWFSLEFYLVTLHQIYQYTALMLLVLFSNKTKK